MRFDEAFDILVEHCARVSADLAAAAGQRVSTYGNDIWIADIVKSYWVQRRAAQETLTQQRYLPFYDAAWKLCRIGVLRLGPHASDDG